jgi:hypothetical protein
LAAHDPPAGTIGWVDFDNQDAAAVQGKLRKLSHECLA